MGIGRSEMTSWGFLLNRTQRCPPPWIPAPDTLTLVKNPPLASGMSLKFFFFFVIFIKASRFMRGCIEMCREISCTPLQPTPILISYTIILSKPINSPLMSPVHWWTYFHQLHMHCVCVRMCLYVYIALYNFITYVALHNHHHNQDNQLQHYKTPSGYLRLLWVQTYPPPFPPVPNHCKPQVCSPSL